jgi:leucyl/phenylalanyl-tRNA--protein transferase
MALIDPDLLLRAYSIGVFPMSDSRDAADIFWVEPRRRAVIPLNGFRLSRSLRKTLRSGAFEVTCDRAFPEVIRHCSEREETWINAKIEDSFIELHRLGRAHSIETWQDRVLVGGLYGIALGAAFFGESMFSRRTDASKVAMSWLVARLKAGGFALLDCQFMTEHLRSLGAVEISQKDYLALLAPAVSSVDMVGAGLAGARGAALGREEAPEFGALDRLLSGAGSPAAAGCVISQLLGHTS